MKYFISYENPLTHFIRIKIEIPVSEGEEKLNLQLPAWRPGRYKLANFAKNIRGFKVLTRQREEMGYKKITKDHWEIECKGEDYVEVVYEYFAHVMDAGNSWLDDTQLYVNFINCMVKVEGREHKQHRVHLNLPEGYEVACALNMEGNELVADDYQELVDSPFIASDNLTHWTYESDGTSYHLWFKGEGLPDKERTLEIFKSFTEAQVKTMGSFPVKDYHFLFQILPYKHFHGVEHKASTVITVGPDWNLHEDELYKHFVGVSSHELFHTWNVCRIRPEELYPYDFSKEAYFETGYVAEGVTTYYGDLFLARSGFFKASEYLEELSTLLKRQAMHYAEAHTSLKTSSLELWLDGYKAGVPDRKMSIYNEGALAALVLDLLIRKETEDSRSLDDVVRRLYKEFALRNRGYSTADYKKIAEEVAGCGLDDYFERFIYGDVPANDYLPELLGRLGLGLEEQKPEKEYEHVFGFRLGIKDKENKIAHIAPGSPAEKVLSLDDELVAVNRRKLTGSFEKMYDGQKRLELNVFRNGLLESCVMEATEEVFYSHSVIVPKDEATDKELQSMKKWLKG